MTGSTASGQIELERNGERGKEKMREREGEAGAVWHYSITIRAVLDSPPFKIKRQISLNSPLDPRGRITLFPQTAQEPVPFACPFSKSPLYNSEHCGFLLLKLCIFKYQVKLQK